MLTGVVFIPKPIYAICTCSFNHIKLLIILIAFKYKCKKESYVSVTTKLSALEEHFKVKLFF